MTRLLDKAISRLRRLPDERQNELAEVILDLAENTDFQLSDAQVAEVKLAVAEADRGEFATEAQMTTLWKRFGR